MIVGAHYDHLGHGDQRDIARGQGRSRPDSSRRRRQRLGHRGRARDRRAPVEAGPADATWCWPCGRARKSAWSARARLSAAPPVPIDRIAAYLNFDMVGRMQNNKLAVQGTGTSAAWPRILERANVAAGFDLARCSRSVPADRRLDLQSGRRRQPASSRPALIPTITGPPTRRTRSTTKIWIASPRSAPRSGGRGQRRQRAGVHEGRSSGDERVSAGRARHDRDDSRLHDRGQGTAAVRRGRRRTRRAGGPDEGRHHHRHRWPVDYEHLRLHVRARAAESRHAGSRWSSCAAANDTKCS